MDSDIWTLGRLGIFGRPDVEARVDFMDRKTSTLVDRSEFDTCMHSHG